MYCKPTQTDLTTSTSGIGTITVESGTDILKTPACHWDNIPEDR
jgi:hypothetical protein